MTYVNVAAGARREFNKEQRLRTEYAGFFNALLIIITVAFVAARHEILVLHVSQQYRLNGIRCDRKDSAEFLARNMQRGFVRGNIMYAIERGPYSRLMTRKTGYIIVGTFKIKKGRY